VGNSRNRQNRQSPAPRPHPKPIQTCSRGICGVLVYSNAGCIGIGRKYTGRRESLRWPEHNITVCIAHTQRMHTGMAMKPDRIHGKGQPIEEILNSKNSKKGIEKKVERRI
jgi:hypothetical protein